MFITKVKRRLKLYKALLADILRFMSRKVLNSKSAAILMYHTVGNGPESLGVDMFRRQMKWLKDHNYNVVRLSQVVSSLKNGHIIASKTVVLTFDDGYADNYIEALPILREFGFPATIFIITNLIDSKLTNKRGVQHTMLSRSQIKEMHNSGLIEFQPHTVKHTRLSYLSDMEAEAELKDSQETIKSHLSVQGHIFAYPFGDHTQRDVKLAKKYFDAAVTVSPGFAGSSNDIFLLPRQAIGQHTTMLRFRLHI